MDDTTEPPDPSPTRDLDDAILCISEYFERAISQVRNLTEVVVLFDTEKLSTSFCRPDHSGSTDLVVSKLLTNLALLQFAGKQLLEQFVKREREISPPEVKPAVVGVEWN